jgi:hypothetical protein
MTLLPPTRQGRHARKPNWRLRIGIALLLVAADALFVENKDLFLSKTRFASVHALPLPGVNLNTDDRALYWTYALYDMGKFRARFGMDGQYAVSRGHARHELELLLPNVSPETMREISAYGAFALRAGGTRKP